MEPAQEQPAPAPEAQLTPDDDTVVPAAIDAEEPARATMEMLVPGADWPAYGGSYHARRFSPLGEITAENVGALEEVWRYRTGAMPEGDSSDYAAETTPLVIDGRMFLCSAMNALIAVDAATGIEECRHDKLGSDWGGVSVDTERGILIANYNDMPNHNRLIPREVVEAAGVEPVGAPGPAPEDPPFDPQAGVPYGIEVNAGWRVPFTGLLCTQPPYGGIRAVDLATGDTLWDRPLGTPRANGPFGIPLMLPLVIARRTTRARW
ncbi:MAG: hypothetical protein H0T41_12155 [Rhodobacteraceae bacterium]|nr:hypothetical protein [Paracoccaceae bacterium]